MIRWPMEAAMKMLVNLIYDPEYKGYVADVPELPGCAQARTRKAGRKRSKCDLRSGVPIIEGYCMVGDSPSAGKEFCVRPQENNSSVSSEKPDRLQPGAAGP